MALTVLLLVASLGIILAAAELFTNAVEWLGVKLNVSEGVVGSIFAAVGTAMPETLIPIVAVVILGGTSHGDQVGIGAILGAPFMLATLAMFVTGLAIVIFSRSNGRSTTLAVNSSVLGRDIRFFLIAYLIAVAMAFVQLYGLRIAVALGLLTLYVYYVYRHAVDEGPEHGSGEDDGEDLHPLRFQPRSKTPALVMVLLQLLISLAIMVGGAYLFVEQVTAVALAVGVPALILSLLIAPIATELPEKLNSVLWVRRGKDTLALGNITGAMVFQSCIPVSFGLVFTSWDATESGSAFISALMALGAGALLYATMRIGERKLRAGILMSCGLFYAAYVVYLLTVVIPSGAAVPH